MKHYFCLDCKVKKSAYGIRCLRCANLKKWENPEYREHMKKVHKVLPENLKKLMPENVRSWGHNFKNVKKD